MKIDLAIDAEIPADVVAIIHRAETVLLSIPSGPSGVVSPAQYAQYASLWIQQAYYAGRIDATKSTHEHYSTLLKNLGKAVQP